MMKFYRYSVVAMLMVAALLSLGISSGIHNGVMAQAPPWPPPPWPWPPGFPPEEPVILQAYEPGDCTVTLSPEASIQAAIDAAPEGALICLEASTWEENLVIKKSLTLRGTGAEETIVKARDFDQPVIRIESDDKMEVTIERLTVAEATGFFFAEGIFVGGQAHVSITDSTVAGNWMSGIYMWGSAQVAITGSTIAANEGHGIFISDSAQATITDSTVAGNGRDGIHILDSAQANIVNNTIQDNEWCGIFSSSSEPVQGRGNHITGNGADLGGNLSAGLRVALVPQTRETNLSFPGPYPTLQATIDALAPGGTIIVAAGTHQGCLTIWKPLTLKGAGPDEVVIEGAVSLIDEAQSVEIEGVTITGSSFAGLLLGGQSQGAITGSTVEGNREDGIHILDSAQAAITGSTVTGNSEDGIHVLDSAHANIIGSMVVHNYEDGIHMTDSAQATITGSTVAWHMGGTGIHMEYESQATLVGNHITGNEGYGVALDERRCFDEAWGFSGYLTGHGNVIPGPDELGRNGQGAVCPSPELDFLMTAEGGEYSGEGR